MPKRFYASLPLSGSPDPSVQKRPIFGSKVGTKAGLIALAAALAAIGLPAFAASATSTSLAITAGGSTATAVSSGTVVTLTATVSASGTAVHPGQVKFCNAAATRCTDSNLLAVAQLTTAGTATYKFKVPVGTHSYKAIFAGTSTYTTSTSSASPLTVPGMNSSTGIQQSGSVGNYTLTATVTGVLSFFPTGTVSFLDTSNSNAVLGTASLVAGTSSLAFTNAYTLGTGTSPTGVAVGDFNGDGIPDIAVANYGSSSVSIFKGNGDGSFTGLASPATGSKPEGVVAADFDGDGILDLAIANFGNNSVTILKGKGDGTFTALASPAAGTDPIALAVGDFDGDGIPDLAVANFGSSSVSILKGNGDGTFTALASPATGNSPRSIVIGDFNGDGIADLAILNQISKSITILKGVGNGTFTALASLTTGNNPLALAGRDFNGDGYLDLAVTNSQDNTVGVFKGNGDGTFTALASVAVSNFPGSVAVVDFNGDGIPDLAVTSNSNTLSVLKGNGDGTFANYATAATGSGPTSVGVGDFNGDGLPDVAVVNGSDNDTSVLISRGTATATATVSGISPAGNGSTHNVDASYPGDANYSASTSGTTGLTSQVATTTTTLTASATSSTYGTAVTLTATIGGTSGATGTVTFSNGSATLGTGTVSSGTATLTTTELPVGTDSVFAAYGGDSGDTASTSNTVSINVTAANTAVGSTSTKQEVVFNFTSTVTLNSTLATAIQVVTQGAANLDFNYASGGTCAAGATYSAGQSCTVLFTFSPKVPGQRLGGISLIGSGNALLASTFITGFGTGPLGVLYPGTLSNVVSGLPDAFGIAIDSSDNLYIATGSVVYKETYNGSSYSGATIGSLSNPDQVAADGIGNVYVNNTGTGTIVKLALNPVTGTYTQSTAITGISLAGLAADGAGNLYIASGANLYKETLGSSGAYTQTTLGTGLNNAFSVAVDASANLYVSDAGAGIVYKYAFSSGTYTRSAIATGLANNNGIAVDAAGIVYVVADNTTSGILRYVPNGSTYSALAAVGTGIPRTNGIAVDGKGNLYVSSDNTTPIGAFRLDVSDPEAFTFNSTAVGSSSAAQTAAVWDIGNLPLTFSAFGVSNSNFALDATSTTCSTGSTLATAGTCNVGFKFTPRTATTDTGTGIVTDNSLNTSGSTQSVALSGTGTAGSKTVTFSTLTSPVSAGTSATLSAYASDNDSVVFTVTSGTATLGSENCNASSGTNICTQSITYTNTGSVTVKADSAATSNATDGYASQSVTVNSAPTSFTATTEPVGTSSGTLTAEVTFTTAGTPGAINVVTQGATGYDYAFVSGGTCSTSTTYTVGQSCSVQYTFTPKAPGRRLGAMTLTSGTTVLGASYLNGTGTGPLANYTAGLASIPVTGLSNPHSVVVDSAGNIYVGDSGNNTVTKYPAGGGTGTTLGSGHNGPTGMCLDGAGTLFITEYGSASVKTITAAGVQSTLSASWSGPAGCTVDGNGIVYVDDYNGTELYSVPGNGGPTATKTALASVPTPEQNALDASGNIYIGTHSGLYRVPAGGGTATAVTVTGYSLATVSNVSIDAAGNLYLADNSNSRVLEEAPNGTVSVLESGNQPWGMALLAGNVYIADVSHARIDMLTRTTGAALTFGATAINYPTAAQTLTIENDGNSSLTISSISPSNSNFTFAGASVGSAAACATTLASGALCGLSATSDPQTAGGTTGSGVVTDNSLNMSAATQTVGFSGSGTAQTPTINSVTPSSGVTGGGASVTINGSNLVGITAVKFGAVASTSFTINSATSITAVSPAGTGTVDITVSNGTYTSATSAADQFTYLTGQTISFTQPATPVFVKAAATLQAAGGASGSAVTFSILSGAATLSGANNSTITYTTPGTVVIAANQAGNASYAAAAQVTRTVTVLTQSVFIANGSGSLTTTYDNATASTLPTAQNTSVGGGGLGASIDSGGYVWSVFASGAGVTKFTDAGASPVNYTATNLTSGTAVAIDGAGTVWIAQGGSQNNVFGLTNAGAVVSGTGLAQAGNISTPTSISVDMAGSLWIANAGNNTVTEVIGVAAPVATPLVQQTIDVTPGTRP